MPRLSKAERLKLIRERLAHPVKPFQTEADKQAAKGKRARRKGEAFQRLIAADFQKIATRFGFEESDIFSRSITGHGDDIVFAPHAFYRFGFLRVECKHFARNADFERIFRQHAQKCADKTLHRQTGVPILVHRSNYQPIFATMRQEDLATLSGNLPEIQHGPEKLVTVPWENVLELLSRKVAASGAVKPAYQTVNSEDNDVVEF